MRLRLVFPRALLLVALAAALFALAALSSLLTLVPLPREALLAWIAGGIVLALLPALLASGSPLPHALAVVVPVLLAASYDQSRLDWLRVLKDYGVADGGLPNFARLTLSLLALLLAWALHALDASLRLSWGATARGIDREQARAAGGVVRARSAQLAALAALGTALAGALALLASRLDVTTLLGGRASLLAPIVAAVLIAVAATVLWVGRRGETTT